MNANSRAFWGLHIKFARVYPSIPKNAKVCGAVPKIVSTLLDSLIHTYILDGVRADAQTNSGRCVVVSSKTINGNRN